MVGCETEISREMAASDSPRSFNSVMSFANMPRLDTNAYTYVNTRKPNYQSIFADNSFMSIGKRLTALLLERKTNPTALSRLTGVPQPTIARTAKGLTIPETSTLAKLAPALGVTVTYLLEGDSPKDGRKLTAKERQTISNIKDPALGLPKKPVISLIQAGEFKEIGALPEPGEGDQWEEHTTKLGSRSWAHIVVGDSMDDGTPNGFPEGTIIFVDPDVAAQAGKYVIAKDVDSQAATFKKLTTDGEKWFLTPLNRQYRAREIDSPRLRVIGVVMESRLPSRRH